MIYRLLDKLVLLLSAEEDKTSPTVPDSDKGIASRKSILIGQFNALDSKSGALLTHISIMIGVLSLMTSPLNAGVSIFERNFLVLALLLYLFAAILCIRCNKLTIQECGVIQFCGYQGSNRMHKQTDIRRLHGPVLNFNADAIVRREQSYKRNIM